MCVFSICLAYFCRLLCAKVQTYLRPALVPRRLSALKAQRHLSQPKLTNECGRLSGDALIAFSPRAPASEANFPHGADGKTAKRSVQPCQVAHVHNKQSGGTKQLRSSIIRHACVNTASLALAEERWQLLASPAQVRAWRSPTCGCKAGRHERT